MRTPKRKMESCDNCGATKSLTREHMVPRWLVSRAIFFGIKVDKEFEYNNIRILCANCNQEKGGMIDYTNTFVRAFIRKVAVNIVEELKKPIRKV